MRENVVGVEDSSRAATRTAAGEAARLLSSLGAKADIHPVGRLGLGSRTIRVEEASPAEDWADSGAMALTGWPDLPPLLPVGRPATVARAAALAFELLTGAAVDGAALLSERAALMGLARGGQVSCGASSRLLPCGDGWWTLNLARDLDLVPALVEADVHDAWPAVTAWGRTRRSSDIVERAALLGMPVAALGEVHAPAAPWHITAGPAGAGHLPRRPLVVNLGSLWAGPLAADLLGLAGAEVVNVEAANRPDPTRHSAPTFYALLRRHVQTVTLDFTDRRELCALLARADAVIEASRPRALSALGLAAEDVMADGRARVWLRIRGHPDPNRVAFGDDAAVAGGLVAWDQNRPVFAGDAIADPLTGLLTALALAARLLTRTPAIIDIRMSELAAYCATGGHHPAKPPTARPPRIALRRPHDAFAD